jgi:hypothetical protein
MKITAKKIDLYVGGVVINCHDAEIEIADKAGEAARKVAETVDCVRRIAETFIENNNPEPVGKTDKPKRKEKAKTPYFGTCEQCGTRFAKNKPSQRFCSPDCVRTYGRKCKQPKGAQPMITGVKNDYAPFTPQP